MWGTRKHDCFKGKKMLLVTPIHGITQEVQGEPMMALDDRMGAGLGDVVLVMDEGNSARQILGDARAPVRTVVCAVVDAVQSGGRTVRYH